MACFFSEGRKANKKTNVASLTLRCEKAVLSMEHLSDENWISESGWNPRPSSINDAASSRSLTQKINLPDDTDHTFLSPFLMSLDRKEYCITESSNI